MHGPLIQISLLRKSSRWALGESNKFPCTMARKAGSSMVSIFCKGMEHPAISTARRLPYSSYFPSQISSVFICENGCGLSSPQRILLFMKLLRYYSIVSSFERACAILHRNPFVKSIYLHSSKHMSSVLWSSHIINNLWSDGSPLVNHRNSCKFKAICFKQPEFANHK